MGYIIFIIAAVLECCPIRNMNWDFGICFWSVFAFLLFVELCLRITKFQSALPTRPRPRMESKENK